MTEHLYLVHYDSDDNYLAHHGILGQKWGFRRYQYEDGSLTPAGKRRYQTGGNADTSAIGSNVGTQKGVQKRLNDIDKAIAYNKRDINEYTKKRNSEMKKRNRDLDKINDYETAINEANKLIEKGKKETDKLIKKAGNNYMNVKSSLTMRNVNRGKDYVMMAAVSLASPFIVLWDKKVLGTKYKVKRDWDREANSTTKKAVDDYVEVANGRMSIKDFNEKYKGTGFRM